MLHVILSLSPLLAPELSEVVRSGVVWLDVSFSYNGIPRLSKIKPVSENHAGLEKGFDHLISGVVQLLLMFDSAITIVIGCRTCMLTYPP